MWKLLRNKKDLIIVFLFIFVFSIPAVFSLFHPGFFLSDDGNWMVVRFSAFYEALRSGQFPVRFLPRLNFGYGYPVADFLYPLFMYIGAPIHVMGANFVNTIKIIFGLSLFVSGFASFFWLRRFVKNEGALVGALIYVFFPYHIFDVYQRGSIGEVLALAIVPLILWQAERKKNIYTAVFLALLILSHNSLAVLFLPFLLGYFFVRKLFSIKELVLLIVFAFGLSAFFWIPALYDKQYTIFDSVSVSSLQSYFLSNSTYFLVGWITVICLLLSLVLLFFKRNIVYFYFFLLTIFSLFMTLPISNGLWETVRIAPFFQFPYRFLSLTILSVSFLGAVSIDIFSRKFQIVSAIFLIIILYVSSWNLLFSKTFQYFPDSFYSTNQDSTTVRNEYMPKWVKTYPLQMASQRITVADESGSVRILQDKGSKIVFSISLMKDSSVLISTIDFPGWKATIDGKETAISHENAQGLIELNVPKGNHMVSIAFTETPIRLFADVLSLFSLVATIIVLIKRKYER